MAVDLRFCIYCNSSKEWNYSGKKLSDGSKLYLDSKGKRWAGKRCPDCERKRVRQALRATAFEKELVLCQLRKDGFDIIDDHYPFTVEKNGENTRISIQRAYIKGNELILDNANSDDSGHYAILFQSVRLISKDEYSRLIK